MKVKVYPAKYSQFVDYTGELFHMDGGNWISDGTIVSGENEAHYEYAVGTRAEVDYVTYRLVEDGQRHTCDDCAIYSSEKDSKHLLCSKTYCKGEKIWKMILD